MSESTTPRSTLDLTAEIVAPHVGYNSVPVDALPALIQEVYRALASVAAVTAAATAAEKPQPAVPVKRSVFPDYIVCLEDGKRLKTLKRHLSGFGLTPDQYRAKWRLPADYPMVAPSYASRRSALAKSLGLGQKNPAAAEQPVPAPTVTHVKARGAEGSRG